MAKNFSPLGKLPKGFTRNPRFVMRVVLGVLLAANLAAGALVLRPWGGSPEELEARLRDLRKQAQTKRSQLERMKLIVAKVEKGRAEGDDFLGHFFLPRRTAYGTLAAELGKAALTAGIRQKEHSVNEEPIEGSDNLTMLTINGNYEGTYADLVHFLNALDRSPQFLIVEGLTATPQLGNTPQASSGQLNVSLRINAFVREEPLQ